MYFNVNGGLSRWINSWYVTTKVEDYNNTEGVPPVQPSSRHWTLCNWWTDVHRKSVKVKVNTLMYGQWALATGLSSLLAYCNKSQTYSCIEKCWDFGSTGTISYFGERFRDGQYSLVTFLFFVHLLLVPPCPVICKSGGTRVRALSSRRHFRMTVSHRGGDLGGQEGIVPFKYLGGGDEGAFIPPPCLENVIANCHSERDWEGEKQKIWHQWSTRKLIL